MRERERESVSERERERESVSESERERESQRVRERERRARVHVWSGGKRNSPRNTNVLSQSYTSQLR